MRQKNLSANCGLWCIYYKDNYLYCNDFDEVEYELMYCHSVYQQIFWVYSAAALESGVGACLPGRLPIAKWPFRELGGVDRESAS